MADMCKPTVDRRTCHPLVNMLARILQFLSTMAEKKKSSLCEPVYITGMIRGNDDDDNDDDHC